jgi:hypothetical protein
MLTWLMRFLGDMGGSAECLVGSLGEEYITVNEVAEISVGCHSYETYTLSNSGALGVQKHD